MSWTVNFNAAWARWLQETDPHPTTISQVLHFLKELKDRGPPEDALALPDESDFYLAQVPHTRVTMRFLAVLQDRYIDVKDVRGVG